MSTVFAAGQNHVLLHCASCSVLFGMPEATNKKLRENHETFYCTLGHQNVYNGKSEEDRLREKVTALETSLANRHIVVDCERNEKRALRRKCIALKGVITRQKNQRQKLYPSS